jgi:hypothetical protein
MSFGAPVSITPGVTYIISYFAPNGNYAADVGFFTNNAVTRGMLTALRSGDDGPNGVYLYAPTVCIPCRW